jgi:GT2 family glycosyltransferase
MNVLHELTIVICTYNRAALLHRMLGSLHVSLAEHSRDVPVLIVDNASTDHTLRVTEEWSSRLRLGYVLEPKQGLSAARNRAVAQVKTEALWFLDDDVVVTKPWFGAVRRALREYPDDDWMGGQIRPQWPSRPPRWLVAKGSCPFKGMLVWYDQGAQAQALTPDMPYFFGANVMFRKRVFADGLRFDEALGPLGRRPRLGDDIVFQAALRRAGRTARYIPDAAVYHPVPPERTRLRYLWDWHYESGLASVSLARRSGVPKQWLGVPRYMYRQTITDLLQGVFLFVAGPMTAKPTRWSCGLARLALGAGKIAAIRKSLHEPSLSHQVAAAAMLVSDGVAPVRGEE